MNDFLTALALLCAGGIISLVLSAKLRGLAYFIFTAGASFFLIKSSLPLLITFSPLSYPSVTYYWSYPIGDIKLVIDSLSALFILIIAVAAFFNSFYAWPASTKGEDKSRLQFFFIALMTLSMLLIVTLRNMLAFLAAWEVMTVASFALVMIRHTKLEEFPFRINYLVAMHVGMLLLLCAVVYVSIAGGTNDFSALEKINSPVGIVVVFVLMFAGFAFKTEFLPFHPWLPIIHPEIPPHVSALISGVMMKTGLYGMLRVLGLLNGLPEWTGFVVLGVAVASALYGAAYAVPQRDMKRLLAYSSMENLGICGIGIGAGMICTYYGYISAAFFAYSGALLHAVNHSLLKPLLFYTSGTVERITGERDMEKLGGLIKHMPPTAYLFLLASAGITALPMLNGFVGEFCIYLGLLKGTVQAGNIGFVVMNLLAIALLALAGSVALVAFSKIFSVVFLGTNRSGRESFPEESILEILPPAGLALLCAAIGLFPHRALALVKNAAQTIIGSDVSILFFSSYALLKKLSFVSISLLLAVIALVSLRFLLSRGRVRRAGTWGCGYNKPTPKIQYTGFSFTENLSVLFSHAVDVRTKRKKAVELFPRNLSFVSICFDSVDSRVYRPLMKRFRIFLSCFGNIQGGSTQTYILYGLVFCIFVILWIVIGGNN